MSMNIFRLCGDMSHVFSILVLLLRLRVAKNAQGEPMGWKCCVARQVPLVNLGSNSIHNQLRYHAHPFFGLSHCRNLGSHPWALSARVRHSLSRLIYDILLCLQFRHEGPLHRFNRFHYLHHSIPGAHQVHLWQSTRYIFALEVRRCTVRCDSPYNAPSW